MSTLKKMIFYAGLAAARSDMDSTYYTPFIEDSGCRSGKTRLTKKQKKARAKTKAQRKARRANR